MPRSRSRNQPEQEDPVSEADRDEEEESEEEAEGEQLQQGPQQPAQQDVLNALAQAATQMAQVMAQMQQVQQQAAAQAPPAPIPQGLFHRSPLSAVPSAGGYLDYTSKTTRKFYEQATKPLFGSSEKFEVEPEKFQTFMERLTGRCKDMGCLAVDRIGMVPENATVPNSPRANIFTDYGSRTLEQVTQYETTYLANQDRNSQDSKIIYDLIMDSLSTTGCNRVAIWKSQHILKINGVEYQAGLCLLKVVVRESSLDSRAMVSSARMELSSLDTYIRNNGSDIVAFNSHVMDLLNTLHSRGETTQDLLVNLFKGYKACGDKGFQAYIANLENQYDDNNLELTHQQLMNLAANYYRKRITNTTGNPWESDPIEERFTALATQMARARKTNPKQPKQPPPKSKKKATARPEWLDKKIKPANPTDTKEFNNHTYYWCGSETGGKCGGTWRQHKPSECKGTSREAQQRAQPDRPTKRRKEEARRLIQAQEAILGLSTDDEANDNSGSGSGSE